MENKKDSPLIEWAKERHKWLQHALYLIVKYGSAESIPETEKNRIKQILIEEAEEKKPSFTPVSDFNIPDLVGRSSQTYLKSLGPVSNVDKLASGQEPFEFVSPNGMTVIFGNNGSGKSGYARILRNLCRSHGVGEPLRSDVTSTLGQKDWEVELSYAEKNGSEVVEHIKWNKSVGDRIEDDAKYNPLRRIIFFDNQVANTYIDGNRDLFYFPPELRLYIELANLATDLKEQIEKKIADLKDRLPKLPETVEGTNSHDVVSKLEKQKITELTEQQLKLICSFSEKEKKELEKFKYKKSQTPKQQKIILEKTKEALIPLKERIERSAIALSSSSLKQLLANYRNYQDAKAVAERGVAGLAKDMPISDGVGSDIWFEMFKAARAFAAQVYPDVTPPPIANGKHCVTCHQELSNVARERLRQFDNFMNGEFQKAADEAKKICKRDREEILSLQNLNSEAIAQQFQQYASLSDTKKEQVKSIASDVEAIASRLHVVRDIVKDASFDNLHTLINKRFQVKADIASFITTIEADEQHVEHLIAENKGGLSPEEYNELSNLQDKEKCFDQKENIKKYFDLLKKIKLLNSCKSRLNTHQITLQSSRRTDELLSTGLKRRYLRELGKLKLNYLKISVENKGQKGEQRIETNIEDLQISQKSKILSEGEQRAIALAGLLTEANETDAGHAIVFDDPVSSLDWDRRGLIAKRLAEEAKKRQVIIFTHDFSFALQLKKYCKDKNRGVNPEQIFRQLWIDKRVDNTGRAMEFGITGETAASWESKSAQKRLDEIEIKISKLEKSGLIPDDTGNSEYERRASEITKQLRQTWERAVEEVALNSTIQRFLPNVMTTNLEDVQFDCSEDYQDLHEGMSIISEPAHDAPQHSGSSSPTIEDLKDNKDLLQNWIRKLKAKRKEYRISKH